MRDELVEIVKNRLKQGKKENFFKISQVKKNEKKLKFSKMIFFLYNYYKIMQLCKVSHRGQHQTNVSIFYTNFFFISNNE